VRARLDADGTLHVEERHGMVFTGDWNGGERKFRLEVDQDLTLLRLSRIDPEAGEARVLTEGGIDQVDHYEWGKGHTLRWRSRLPSDPPFEGTVIPYVIEYTLSGVLRKIRGSYRLSHDFAFSDRSGPIERFSLDLVLDPAWKRLTGVPAHVELENVPPGESVIVTGELAYTGPGEALSGIRTGTPLPLRYGMYLFALTAMAVLYFRVRDREKALGRYSPPPTPAEWDQAWLQENLFLYRPEEVGALWDQTIGAPEVAAVLARLVGEGKLASEVVPKKGFFGHDVLRLTRKAELHEFVGYERKLVDKLFFDGGSVTDTDRVRNHYRSRGFNPAKEIETELRTRLEGHAELRGKTAPPARSRTAILFLMALGLFAADAFSGQVQTLLLVFFVFFLSIGLYIFGLTAAIKWRKRTEALDAASLTFLLPGLGVLGVVAIATFWNDWPLFAVASFRPGLLGDIGLISLALAAWSSLLNNAMTRESPETIHRRQLLGAGRRLLRRELKSQNPRLKDEWMPYLLAFGLQGEMDRWFRAFGGVSRSGFSPSSSSYGSSGGSSGGGWSGGGGSFGGAGSTSSWAAAATGLAAGVSAPSSSGGSSGGGGGSSTGGGGGGGW